MRKFGLPEILLVAGCILTILFAGALVKSARAQGIQPHHEFHKEFYRTWKQPNSDSSCCDARITAFGVERGDCEPTLFRLKTDVPGISWQAWLRQEGKWIDIPDSKIIHEKNPTQGGVDGHLCARPSGAPGFWLVLCAVPPFGGG